MQEQDTIFPATECRIKYKHPARYDDVLDVAVWITGISAARVTFGYQIINAAGKAIIEAETTHVCSSTREKPKRIPAELAQSLQGYLKADETA